MFRLILSALLVLGFAAAPVAVDGLNEAQAQKAKKTVKRKKTSKAVKRKTVKRKGKAGATKATKAKKNKKNKVVKLRVKAAIRNTNEQMKKARLAVKTGSKGADMLRASVIRQHAARKAFAEGKARQAFMLTRLARKLSLEIITLNGLTADKLSEDPFEPESEDLEIAEGYIKAVEEEGKVPAVDVIADDTTIGEDLPEDLGEDDAVAATTGAEQEVEVETQEQEQ